MDNNIVYISLGSNLGNRDYYLSQAIKEIEKLPETFVSRATRIMETTPVGKIDQPDFLNQVIEVCTTFSASALLEKLLAIEKKLGRVRIEKWGPRTIDLDILFYNDRCIETNRLVVPHPEISNRDFLLELLHELIPKYIHPLERKSIQQLYESICVSGTEK